MIWGLLLIVMALLSAPISLIVYWKVFGIWPVSWTWFVVFAFVQYAQQQWAQYCVKRMMQWHNKQG